MTSHSSLATDTNTATNARVYDCFLGGKDHFAVDREVYRHILTIAPQAAELAQEGRGFLMRAVSYLAASGIDQFLDVGCGLPTADNTHDAAQRGNPDAVVVYVDNDPAVAAYGRALLEDHHSTHLVMQDLRDPQAVLANPVITSTLDFTRPVALLHGGTVHHLHDWDNPVTIMCAYNWALPPGSYVALTHFHDPADADPAGHELARDISHCLQQSSIGASRFRTKSEIAELLSGLEIQPAGPQPGKGGIVPVRDWWPTGPRLDTPEPIDGLLVAALARKPPVETPSRAHPQPRSVQHLLH